MAAEFEWTPEQVELRRTVRTFSENASPETEVRRLMDADPGYDQKVWARLGADLGVLGLAVPEEYGGGGDGWLSQAVVAEELGRVLMPGPFVGSILLAATALAGLDDEKVKTDRLPGLLDGSAVGTVATPLGHAGFDPAAVTVAATGSGGGWTLRGQVPHVVDGTAADLLLVPARTGEGVALFLADAGDTAREALPVMDRTRRQAAVTFTGTPATLVAADAAAVLEPTLDTAAVLLAAEQVGAAQAMLDLSVEYARTRIQFGRQIGSFQAVKHLCADMLVAVEQARSTVYHAAWALDAGGDDPRIAASLALATSSDAFSLVARATIQVHGGIGFTWEHPAHLYLKRSVTDAALLGSATEHRDRLAALVLD